MCSTSKLVEHKGQKVRPCMELLVLIMLFTSLLVYECNATQDEVSSIICTCRCCYQGGCKPLANVAWPVESCALCQTKMCNEYLESQVVREKTEELFAAIKGINASSANDMIVDECEVMTVVEYATCTGKLCKRTTTIKAECYNRDSPLMKYSIISFVMITLITMIFGFVKTYIPAFQPLNSKYFNY